MKVDQLDSLDKEWRYLRNAWKETRKRLTAGQRKGVFSILNLLEEQLKRFSRLAEEIAEQNFPRPSVTGPDLGRVGSGVCGCGKPGRDHGKPEDAHVSPFYSKPHACYCDECWGKAKAVFACPK